MSDVMLLGVLEMPPELWGPDDGPINDSRQRYSRYLEAAQRIRSDADEITHLRALLERALPIVKDAEKRWRLEYMTELLADLEEALK